MHTTLKKVINRTFKSLSSVTTNNNADGLIIYHAMTAYHFLLCVVDKILFNKDKQGAFLISEYVASVYPNYKKLFKYFDYICIYDIHQYSSAEDTKECEYKIITYYDKLLADSGIEIEKANEIHIAGAHHGFGYYVYKKNKPFYFYEEAAGILSRSEIISNYEKERYPIKYLLTQQSGLFDGKNELIIENRCVIDAQVEGFKDDKANNYEVAAHLRSIGNKDKEFLANFFHLPHDIPFKSKNNLVLGQQLYFNGRHLSQSESILTYQLLLDYYLKDENIIFKPHPADQADYESFLDGVYILRDKFPSELLAIVPKANFHEAITINSTAIYNVNKIAKEIKSIGYWFLDFRNILHRIWAAFEILKISSDEDSKYYHFGLHNEQMWNYVKFAIEDEQQLTSWLPINDIPLNSVSIINDIKFINEKDSNILLKSMESLDKSSVLIFINEHKDYCFCDVDHPELMEYIVPIVLTKRRIRENSLENLQDEVIYVFCKDQYKRDIIKKLKLERRLAHSGIFIQSKSLSEQEMDQLMLEARIAALERKVRDLSKRV